MEKPGTEHEDSSVRLRHLPNLSKIDGPAGLEESSSVVRGMGMNHSFRCVNCKAVPASDLGRNLMLRGHGMTDAWRKSRFGKVIFRPHAEQHIRPKRLQRRVSRLARLMNVEARVAKMFKFSSIFQTRWPPSLDRVHWQRRKKGQRPKRTRSSNNKERVAMVKIQLSTGHLGNQDQRSKFAFFPDIIILDLESALPIVLSSSLQWQQNRAPCNIWPSASRCHEGRAS